MSKDSIKREMLKKNIMKEAILRIDYTGIISIDDSINLFTKNFINSFKEYEKTFYNRIDLGNIQIEQISETLSVPIKELEKQTIHRFTQNTIGPDELIFDISSYFSVLHIKCKDYVSITNYLNFFSDFLDFLCQKNEFILFKRFGLRKIGFEIFESIDEISKHFENYLFLPQLSNPLFKSAGNQYVDLLVSDDNLFNFTLKRIIDKGYLKTEKEIKEAYQAILDIDGYITEENIKIIGFRNKNNLYDSLTKLNNVYLFDLFKTSMTEIFLQENQNERN